MYTSLSQLLERKKIAKDNNNIENMLYNIFHHDCNGFLFILFSTKDLKYEHKKSRGQTTSSSFISFAMGGNHVPSSLSLSLSLSLIIVFAKYISSFLLHEDKQRKVSKKALSQTPKKARKH
jgi:hypothetical protein